ncbi:aldehyde dehydrogenase [Algibacter pectinivorans]|uniref:Aldehyde dehydrogenase n=1 Tax=Algibacter pectinivorans TaxID=870482 RepID=A0A1I1RNL2_9FLAO|nr:aldehyde dehydrogenase [Algibacter pectinivorans]SFD35617.1 aldehyde dehydrogenase (NAD+) [Algibacter pectinivorans]
MKSISELISVQHSFFKSQKTKDIDYRLSLLKALKKEILNKEQAILDALHKDFKKSQFEAYLSEIGIVLSELNLAIKNLKKWAKPKRIKASLLTFPSKDYIYKEPYGTVLIIAPWNYPFLLAMEPLIMAIAAGNTVVLKPSELTVNTSKIITSIIEHVFPEDVAISIEGGVETSTELLAQKWDFIFFTGSTTVGKIVAKAAAKHLTPTILELGGKSPCIIDDSVDIKLVATRLVWGKLLNGGQTCIAPDYVIVKSNIKQDLIKALKAEIINRYSDNPKNSADFPRIVNTKNTKRLAELIKDTTIVHGGEIDETTCYIAPTLIDEPNIESPIMQEEIFGPILPILVYDTASDIEKIIWHLDKPLSLYVFSNKSSFINETINKFSFGGGVVNDLLIHFGNHRLPFGGVGASGIGEYHGKHGFDAFSNTKPIVKRGNWIDPSFRYAPYNKKVGLLKTVFKYLG